MCISQKKTKTEQNKTKQTNKQTNKQTKKEIQLLLLLKLHV